MNRLISLITVDVLDSRGPVIGAAVGGILSGFLLGLFVCFLVFVHRSNQSQKKQVVKYQESNEMKESRAYGAIRFETGKETVEYAVPTTGKEEPAYEAIDVSTTKL
eukprot:m.107378 g.107378  ORF g.107378 m.107378 type:complete len:106 (+) comp37295_c0_seq1:91-408(+)